MQSFTKSKGKLKAYFNSTKFFDKFFLKINKIIIWFFLHKTALKHTMLAF